MTERVYIFKIEKTSPSSIKNEIEDCNTHPLKIFYYNAIIFRRLPAEDSFQRSPCANLEYFDQSQHQIIRHLYHLLV